MTDRISTSMMYSQSVSSMTAKQSRLNQLEAQLASGQRLVTAKDDPVAAGTALGLDRALAAITQFGENANNVKNRLGLQETVLAQAGDAMTRVNELAIQANSSALAPSDRKAIASELTALRDSMVSLANSTDGTGRYLFGGAADGSAPFIKSNGGVTYNGDQTQKQVEVAPDTFVSDTLPGSEIFMRIRTGDGSVDALANGANTGTGLLLDFSRDSSTGSWNGSSYSVQFTAANTYEVRDSANAVVSTGTYKDGEDINAAGVRMRISGAPAVGDSFQIGASGTKDVFSTIDDLVGALNADTLTPPQKAAMINTLQTSMRDIAQASSKVIDARASGGAQLSAIDNVNALLESNEVTLKTTLSSIRDLDYASAIGQYQLEKASLQAAQTIFQQMQSLSLFDLIR
ncbi:flagellar hook-associated protein FlgL [Xanthomonas fragariae]|uniref:flagellar hook-associated protein FlgL n=1 Tax=Xanthomonas fragariae TaxID=48664 RepID=UPI000D55AC3E|nr:flagellar hook-associated protein FlgL [Xanthomonas fragariae]MDM7553838.1 flagellar hook-associated protein FlgL [Xanthomonas fragariae]MDM7556986.1 flagellar hook-associated protein FlgL [Xanthomonas fragariae]MDM7574670.1 flagellar hook-associated protein FlgL [Xanthomonas fragariae]MDM7577828.1 flagellar hook-associated protein FlgL [Xanthomonas fragariae]MDM7588003.1 flagellar hook-associated protein FlgL [Xanthomonas fragariae]